MLVLPAGEHLRCLLSLWKTEELLWQINFGVEKTAAVDLSDISLDANIPEGDAYDFLTTASCTDSPLLLSLKCELPGKLGCVFVAYGFMCAGCAGENKVIPGHLSFNPASAMDLHCGFRQITS